MPDFRTLPACGALALALLAGCRPGDAPKEPTEPTEPTVSRAVDAGGGVHTTVSRRAQALARL